MGYTASLENPVPGCTALNLFSRIDTVLTVCINSIGQYILVRVLKTTRCSMCVCVYVYVYVYVCV